MNIRKTGKSPIVFVIDLDETLIHCKKEMCFKIKNKTTSLPLVFVRPKLKHFLRKIVKHGDIVLFSLGNKKYVRHILKWYFFGLKNLFKHTLTLEDALLSYNLFGKFKHSKYVTGTLGKYKECAPFLIGIDDLACENMDIAGYYRLYSPQPFKGNYLDNLLVVLAKKIDKLLTA